jgi:hypothetical protein
MPLPQMTTHASRRPIAIRLTPAIRAWLDEEHARRGISRNALILIALERAMEASTAADQA